MYFVCNQHFLATHFYVWFLGINNKLFICYNVNTFKHYIKLYVSALLFHFAIVNFQLMVLVLKLQILTAKTCHRFPRIFTKIHYYLQFICTLAQKASVLSVYLHNFLDCILTKVCRIMTHKFCENFLS